VRRRPMPSLRDSKLGVMAVSLAYLQVIAYFRRPGPYVTVRYDLQRDSAFRFGLNRILICAANQKSICDVSEPMSGSGTSLDRARSGTGGVGRKENGGSEASWVKKRPFKPPPVPDRTILPGHWPKEQRFPQTVITRHGHEAAQRPLKAGMPSWHRSQDYGKLRPD
jgi:hypothetical protein